MESSITTLEREVKEELNLPCKVVRLLWHVEDFYKFGDKETHEIGYYYEIEFPDHPEIYEKNEPWTVHEEANEHEGEKMLTFHWIPLNTLDSVSLIPKYIKEQLSTPPSQPRFITINHLKKRCDS